MLNVPTIARLATFARSFPAWANTTPFTYQDGLTNARLMESLISYVDKELVPFVDAEMVNVIEAWKTTVAEALDGADSAVEAVTTLATALDTSVRERLTANETAMLDAIATVVENSVELQAEVVEAIFADVDSAPRQLFDDLFASADIVGQVDTIAQTINAGRLSAVSIAATQDQTTAANIQNPTTATGEAFKRALSNGGVYLPHEYTGIRWRLLRDAVLSGERQGHIAVLADSIGKGFAVANPKHLNSWPGRMRARLDHAYGSAGTGIILAENPLLANPVEDSRIASTGSVSEMPYGFYRQSCWRLAAQAGTAVYVQGTSDTTVVYGIPAGGVGLNTVTSEGVSVTIRNTDSGAIPDRERDSRYAQLVTPIHWGSVVADRMVSIAPPAVGSPASDAYLIGVEMLIAEPGTFRVTNASVSGQSLGTLFANANYDDGNLFFGLSMVDMLDADLLIVALGINDWQSAKSIPDLKSALSRLIARQRQQVDGQHFGDTLLVWNPVPELETFQPENGPEWEAYREAFYEVATENNVPLLDLGLRWGTAANAALLGTMTDGLHPNTVGSFDMASAITGAILSI